MEVKGINGIGMTKKGSGLSQEKGSGLTIDTPQTDAANVNQPIPTRGNANGLLALLTVNSKT